MSQNYDIIVLGAGPAGANAALSAARLGHRVALVDEQSLPGGQIWRAKSEAIVNAPPTPETTDGDSLRRAIASSAIEFLDESRAWQIECNDGIWAIHVLRRGASDVLHGRALVLAAGALEYVQPVPGWTTPGVFGLAGATALMKRDLMPPGAKTVVSGTGPMVFFAASEIRRLGGEVAAVVTPNTPLDWLRAVPSMLGRPDLLTRGAIWLADLKLAGVPVFWRHAVCRVDGATQVKSADVTKLDANWRPVRSSFRIDADSVCLGNGLIPDCEPARLAGLGLRHRPQHGGWVPIAHEDGATDIAGLFVCGDGAGIKGAAAAELHGQMAGLGAAAFLGSDPAEADAGLLRQFRRAVRFGTAMTSLSVPRSGLSQLTTPDTIVCRCESIPRVEIEQEITQGASSTISVKSGLRAGMGPCGGKFCQTAIGRLVALSQGKSEADVPLPTARPPLRPVIISTMARGFDYDDLPIATPAPE